MKPAAFDYYCPDTIEETVSLLSEYGDDSLLLAGGLSLGAMLNMRIARPSVLIDINKVNHLDNIIETDGHLKIGALVRQGHLTSSKKCSVFIPLLAEGMKHLGHYQTRSRGTIGGSVAHADPSAEIPLCAVTLGGEVELMSSRGKRTVAANDFFVGALETLRAEDELVTGVNFPIFEGKYGVAFDEISERKGDFAIVAAAACVAVKDEQVQIKIGLGGIEDRPRYIEFNDSEIEHKNIYEDIDDFISELVPLEDRRASGAFRQQLAGHLSRKVFKIAMENCDFEAS